LLQPFYHFYNLVSKKARETAGIHKLFELCAESNIHRKADGSKWCIGILNPRILRRLQCWDMDC